VTNSGGELNAKNRTFLELQSCAKHGGPGRRKRKYVHWGSGVMKGRIRQKKGQRRGKPRSGLDQRQLRINVVYVAEARGGGKLNKRAKAIERNTSFCEKREKTSAQGKKIRLNFGAELMWGLKTYANTHSREQKPRKHSGAYKGVDRSKKKTESQRCKSGTGTNRKRGKKR